MPPPELTPRVLLVLAIMAGAFALFLWNRVRADVVALLVMATLIVTGLVSPRDGTSGFANEATITVALMMVLAAGLARTGAMEALGRWVGRFAGRSELRLTAAMLAIVIPASAFINNTPIVIVMLPVVLGVARKAGFAPSRLLIPLSFGSQLGGTMTLIGTSTNLLVAALIVDMGLGRLELFAMTPPAFILTAIGAIYLLTVARWLLPARDPPRGLLSAYELREYLTALEVEPASWVAGRTLGETTFQQRVGLQVVAIQRSGVRLRSPGGSTRIERGDLLLVRGRIADIAQIARTVGLRISGSPADLIVGTDEDAGLAEFIVPPRSRGVGRTLRDLGFRTRHGLTVLALQRHGSPSHAPIGAITLRAGDILLVQGPSDAMRAVHEGGDFALLGAVDLPARRHRKMKVAAPIVVAVVLLAAFDVTSIMVAALLGAIAMLLTGCIKPDEAYRDVDWMVLVLLAGIIPLGFALQNTGAAALIAFSLLDVIEPLGPYGSLGAFYLMTSVLTEFVSNNAAAVVLTPIAIAVATGLGVSPWPFVIGTMLAASNAFMTPIGYQTNTFIYGPGGYTFGDFLRVGAPLSVLLAAAATVVIPIFFPF